MSVFRASNFVEWFFAQGAAKLSQEEYLALKEVQQLLPLLRYTDKPSATQIEVDCKIPHSLCGNKFANAACRLMQSSSL